MKKTYLFIFGTRPEAIKLAPLIIKFIEKREKVIICNTGQHRDLVDKELLNSCDKIYKLDNGKFKLI